MKKTYISPSTLTVRLVPRSTVLTTSSVGLDNSDGNKLGSGDILVNEYNPVSDKSLWDNEW